MKGANKTAFNESAGYLFTMNEERKVHILGTTTDMLDLISTYDFT